MFFWDSIDPFSFWSWYCQLSCVWNIANTTKKHIQSINQLVVMLERFFWAYIKFYFTWLMYMIFCPNIRFVLTMENDQLTKELEHPVVTPTCVTMAAGINEHKNSRLWKQVCLKGESTFLLINSLNLFFLRTIFMPFVCHANSKK